MELCNYDSCNEKSFKKGLCILHLNYPKKTSPDFDQISECKEKLKKRLYLMISILEELFYPKLIFQVKEFNLMLILKMLPYQMLILLIQL